jgi:hypothetical protein
MSTPTMDEVLKLISEKTIEYANSNPPKQISIPAFNDGAHFGYSLQNKVKDERIKELEYDKTIREAGISGLQQRIAELEKEKKDLLLLSQNYAELITRQEAENKKLREGLGEIEKYLPPVYRTKIKQLLSELNTKP